MSAQYINRERRASELGDPYFGCGEQDLIPRTVTSVFVWCAGKEISQRLLGLRSKRRRSRYLETYLDLEENIQIFEMAKKNVAYRSLLEEEFQSQYPL